MYVYTTKAYPKQFIGCKYIYLYLFFWIICIYIYFLLVYNIKHWCLIRVGKTYIALIKTIKTTRVMPSHMNPHIWPDLSRLSTSSPFIGSKDPNPKLKLKLCLKIAFSVWLALHFVGSSDCLTGCSSRAPRILEFVLPC